jgi:hypothetical protein
VVVPVWYNFNDYSKNSNILFQAEKKLFNKLRRLRVKIYEQNKNIVPPPSPASGASPVTGFL